MSGAELIELKHQRQIADKGWTAEHDDEQKHGELSRCACKILAALHRGQFAGSDNWPEARGQACKQQIREGWDQNS